MGNKKSRQSAKPYPDFPLTAHPSGNWCKKIRGKLHYFGSLADPQAALNKYLDQRDDLQAGRVPRAKSDGLTIRQLCNHFLTAKHSRLSTRELSMRTFTNYKATCEKIVGELGGERLVADLRAADFEQLRAKLAEGRGAVSLGNGVRDVRIVFKYGYDSELLDKPVRFGGGFKAPSRKVLREERNAKPPRMFEAAELRALLGSSGVQMRALILLAINAGYSWGKWLTWTGSRWEIDDGDAVLRLAKTVADDLWQEARQNMSQPVALFVSQTSGTYRLNAMLKLAAAEVPVAVEDLDADRWLLNCPNATIDLRTGELREHDRHNYCTKQCPTRFNPDATAPHWEAFLQTVFGGDTDLIQFLQRLCGYILTGDVSEQILPILHGQGSNGKSTLLNAITATLGGDYTTPAPPGLLVERKGDSHPTELASLFGKRLVIAQETAQGARLAEPLVKQLTGDDAIPARRMREDFWTFKPTHKLLIASNHKPRVAGTDHAIWRRLVLIPFARKFWNPAAGEDGPPELMQDKTLSGKLTEEAPGILAWMVQGCLDWQRTGLQIPESVRAATNSYRTNEDVIGQFTDDCCLIGPMYRVKFSDFYSQLETWANDTGFNVPSRRSVSQWLKERGFDDQHSTVRWYLGLGIREPTDSF